jgi:uncharacterized protein YbjT (DUF2867 family)
MVLMGERLEGRQAGSEARDLPAPTGAGAPSEAVPVRVSVLVTGATGYIGGRLVPRLLDSGHAVRCLVRSAEKLRTRSWSGRAGLEVVEGEIDAPERLRKAMSGCSVAYYLVHSMAVAGTEYAERDRALALAFGRAAAAAGVGRIIYLGGLGEEGAGLSEHLASRREVESALAAGGVPVTTLRAAMIVGSGSASFEILRYLVERLPVMVTPRWVGTVSQPIAVRDVLDYLIRCLSCPETIGRAIDIGGPDVFTYRELMQEMARALGLRRRVIVPVPVLTPRLSSLWIHLVTPVSAAIARPLAEGLRNPVVCRDRTAEELMPGRRLGMREAIAAALEKVTAHDVETAWSDAGPIAGDPDWAGGTIFRDCRTVTVSAHPSEVFAVLQRIGGGHGWFASDGLWRLRGFIDRLVGGPGLRRGRRDPERLAYGDALDFWRVVGITVDRELRLRAEMKLPGDAELDFTLAPLAGGGTRLTQTATFKPRGLAGILYWYGVLPLHSFVFRGMIEGVRRTAESGAPGQG